MAYQAKYPDYLEKHGITKQAWNDARDRLPDYLISNKGLNLRKNFRCLNPDHDDQSPSMGYDPAGKVCHCFGCGKTYDIFDLIGMDYNIDNFIDRVKTACNMYGIPISEPDQAVSVQKSKQTTTKTNPGKYNMTFTIKPESAEPAEDLQSSGSGEKHEADPQPEQPAEAETGRDYSELIRAAAVKFDHSPAEEYLKSRGISTATAARFAIGYEPAFPFTIGKSKALIIPAGDMIHHIKARNIDPEQKNRYECRGPQALFNVKALQSAEKDVYIVEGELDALSVIEAGGDAVGLGSTSNEDQLIDYLKKHGTKSRVILALDNDDAGRKTSDGLAGQLKQMKIPFIRFNPYGKHKDANEALTAERDSFFYRINHPDEVRADEYRKSVSASAYIDSFLTDIKQSRYNRPISTGFSAFDATIDGGLYKGLYVIGAVSSVGKTTFCLQIADQIAESGHDVMIFSLEMARKELIARSISRETVRIPWEASHRRDYAKTIRGITDGSRYEHYSTKDLERINQAVEKYQSYSDHVIIKEQETNTRLTISEIRSQIEEHKNFTGSYPVVLIDYLQIMKPADPRMTDKQSADHNITTLRQISRDLPIIVISSLNRESYNGKNKNKGEIMMADLKESGGIEYGADVIIALQFAAAGDSDFKDSEAKREDPRQIVSVVLKNRNGKVFEKAAFDYMAAFNYFTEKEVI